MYMKSKTFNMSLPASLLAKIDAVAKREYRNRSELIREALRKYVQDIEEWEALFTYGHQQAREKGVKSERQVNEIVRQYRHGA